MKKLLAIILMSILMTQTAYSQCKDAPVRIAVIDTGFGYAGNGKETTRLCKDGHMDFTQDGLTGKTSKGITYPLDTHGHGTNVAGIIDKKLKSSKVNYCIVIMKWRGRTSYLDGLQNTILAFRHITKEKIPYANYSAGGEGASERERKEVVAYLDGKGVLVVAAGNSGINLDFEGRDYYPAKYDPRIVVVGAVDKDGKQVRYSNFGKVVDRWELGVNVEGNGISLSGTSQATAIATGKIVSENPNKCDIGK